VNLHNCVGFVEDSIVRFNLKVHLHSQCNNVEDSIVALKVHLQLQLVWLFGKYVLVCPELTGMSCFVLRKVLPCYVVA